MTLDAPTVDAIATRVAEILRAQPAPPRPLLSAEQLAVALGVSRDMITKLSRAGLPVVRIVRSARYDFDEVKLWLKTRSTPAAAPETNDPPARRLTKRSP